MYLHKIRKKAKSMHPSRVCWSSFHFQKIPSFYFKERSPKRKFGIQFVLIIFVRPPKWAKLVFPMVNAKIFYFYFFSVFAFKQTKKQFCFMCNLLKKKDFIGVVTILQLQYWELSLAELGNSLLGFELAAAWTFGCCSLQSATFKRLNKKIKIGRF